MERKCLLLWENISSASSPVECKENEWGKASSETRHEKHEKNVVDEHFKWCDGRKSSLDTATLVYVRDSPRSYMLEFSCKLCDVSFVNLYSSLDWGPIEERCDSAEKIIRDLRGRCLEVNKRQWQAYCARIWYASGDMSSFRGARLVAKHQSKTIDRRIVSMWVPNLVMKESRLCTFVTYVQQHLMSFISQCVLQGLVSTGTFLVTKKMER